MSRRWGVAATFGWFAAAIALQLLRQQGAPAVDTVWAEDGSIFLAQPVIYGWLPALVEPYNGYFHLLPRLLGGGIALLPMQAAAWAFAVLPSAIVAALSVYVFVVSGQVLRSVWSRAFLALVVVIPPPGGWETTANATNLQWNLIYPCFWALLVRPRTRPLNVVSAVVAGATALSSPIALVLAPISVWSLWRRRGSRTVHATFLAAAAVQLAISLGEGLTSSSETSLGELLALFGLRVGAGTVLGDRLLLEVWPALGWTLAAVGSAVFVAVAAGCLKKQTRERSVLLIALAAAAATFMAPVYLRGTSLLIPLEGVLSEIGARWVVAPILLLTTVLVVLAERAAARRTARSLSLAFVITGALAVGLVTSYPAHNQRSPGPRWSVSVEEAAGRCEARDIVAVPVSHPGFAALLPCDRLRPPDTKSARQPGELRRLMLPHGLT